MDPLRTALAAHTPLEAFGDGEVNAPTMAPMGEMSSAPLPEAHEDGEAPAEAREAVDRQIFGALVTV